MGDVEKKPEDEEKKVQANFAEDSGDDKKKDDDKSEDMEGGGLDVAGVVKAIESGEISIADMDAILTAIAAQKGAAQEEEEQPAPAAVPGGEAMRAEKSGGSEQFAQMRGEIEALRAKDRERDERDKRKADVANALVALRDKPLGSDLEERLEKFHAEHGLKAFAAYVESMGKTFADLGVDSANAENFRAHNPKLPEVAMKYQADGVQAVDRAAKFAAEYDQLKATGHTRMSQERYVQLNMEREKEAVTNG